MFISEAKAEVAKALPAVGGAAYSAITLNTLVALATLIYIVLQAAYLGWKWYGEYKAKQK